MYNAFVIVYLELMNETEITFSPEQLFAIIDLPCKPYAGIMSSSAYFMIKRRFADGTVKENTLDKFFAKFGFEGTKKRYRSIAQLLPESVTPGEV